MRSDTRNMLKNGNNKWRKHMALHQKLSKRLQQEETSTMTKSGKAQCFFQVTWFLWGICQNVEALESCAHTGTSKHTLLCHQRGENNPVYEVKRERGTGRGRILHQNMLMPCHASPLEKPAQCTVGGQKPHSQQRKRQTETKTQQIPADSENSDEEEHYWAQTPPPLPGARCCTSSHSWGCAPAWAWCWNRQVHSGDSTANGYGKWYLQKWHPEKWHSGGNTVCSIGRPPSQSGTRTVWNTAS